MSPPNSRWSNSNGSGRETSSLAKSAWRGLSRKLNSRGLTAEGTRRTAVSIDSTQREPKSASSGGAGNAFQPSPNKESGTVPIGRSPGIRTSKATNGMTGRPPPEWTMTSSAARERAEDVYTHRTPARCHRPADNPEPSPLNAPAARRAEVNLHATGTSCKCPLRA